MSNNSNWHGTTIVLIRKGSDVVVAGDGQVSLGNTVIKSTAIDPDVVVSDGVYRKVGPARVFTSESAAIAALNSLDT